MPVILRTYSSTAVLSHCFFSRRYWNLVKVLLIHVYLSFLLAATNLMSLLTFKNSLSSAMLTMRESFIIMSILQLWRLACFSPKLLIQEAWEYRRYHVPLE